MTEKNLVYVALKRMSDEVENHFAAT
jgi:hypothetical protein